ncbi:MAG: RT0821/Lpp0805 family surface protein, partial [Alphaproteobacteria bacterium]
STIGKGGGKLVAVAAGTMLGALLGSEIGRSLDKADQAHANRTTQQSLESAPTGKPSRWVNPDSGHSGSVTPTRTFKTARGQDCREFEQTVTIDGRTEVAYGTACRQADGTWKIVNA